MALPLPRSLSPSKVGSFTTCALAFRFAAIDRLPEPPSVHTLKGTLVHTALEGLFWNHRRGSRSPAAALAELQHAWGDVEHGPELDQLGLTDQQRAELRDDAELLVHHAFALEDPDAVDALGVEVTLEVQLDGLRLRGIIDRLDRGPDGELVVVDYKTGRVPRQAHEQASLAGVYFYALLCEQVLGERPARVELRYLRQPLTIEATPTDQSMRGLRLRTGAVWRAIERACTTEDFRPHPSALCGWCAFQQLCPAYGAGG